MARHSFVNFWINCSVNGVKADATLHCWLEKLNGTPNVWMMWNILEFVEKLMLKLTTSLICMEMQVMEYEQ